MSWALSRHSCDVCFAIPLSSVFWPSVFYSLPLLIYLLHHSSCHCKIVWWRAVSHKWISIGTCSPVHAHIFKGAVHQNETPSSHFKPAYLNLICEKVFHQVWNHQIQQQSDFSVFATMQFLPDFIFSVALSASYIITTVGDSNEQVTHLFNWFVQ